MEKFLNISTFTLLEDAAVCEPGIRVTARKRKLCRETVYSSPRATVNLASSEWFPSRYCEMLNVRKLILFITSGIILALKGSDDGLVAETEIPEENFRIRVKKGGLPCFVSTLPRIPARN